VPGYYTKRGNSVSELPLSDRILLQCELDRVTVLAAGLAARSTPLKIAALGPSPGQPQEMDCTALNTANARLLAERDDLNTPLPSSNTDAEREAEITQVNGKLYTVEKAQFNKNCPAVAKPRHLRLCGIHHDTRS